MRGYLVVLLFLVVAINSVQAESPEPKNETFLPGTTELYDKGKSLTTAYNEVFAPGDGTEIGNGRKRYLTSATKMELTAEAAVKIVREGKPENALLIVAANGRYAWLVTPDSNEIKLRYTQFGKHSDIQALISSAKQAGKPIKALDEWWIDILDE